MISDKIISFVVSCLSGLPFNSKEIRVKGEDYVNRIIKYIFNIFFFVGSLCRVFTVSAYLFLDIN